MMILGMSVATFTLVHVILSLVGIVTGLIVLRGMFAADRLPGWTVVFLATTVLTSVTGFFFPTASFDPAKVVGVISLLALAAAIIARYGYQLAGAWRWIYVVGAVLALYLNCFVAVVQAFQKLPFLEPLAPTQSEPPFQIAQGVVLVLFIVLGIFAAKGFHPERGLPA
jgi:hypothetical protein